MKENVNSKYIIRVANCILYTSCILLFNLSGNEKYFPFY